PFRGTISRLGNVLWSTPLRIFLGLFWILAALGSLGSLNSLFWQHDLVSFIEIITGAGILIGLLTWPLALVSIILAITAWSVNGFDVIHLFLILSSIAVMNGSGRGFGLDFYVIPLLQKLFGGLWYGKAKSLYDELDK
ncbi:MAG: NADH-quinone oxidoreductase subunit D, partial [Leuconostoc gelidum]